MNKQLINELKNPGSEYRGAPFWAWNGKLKPDELRRQIRLMHHMGLGGFFMHSRVGLATPYLSEEWMKCIETCVDEAEKLDMQAWLYDEDRWPSGAAGGLVTKDEKYRMHNLVLEHVQTPGQLKWNNEVLAAFVVKITDKTVASHIRQLARNTRPAAPAKGEEILVFRDILEKCSGWYNGYTYLDTMSREAVRKFIEVTHASYLKRFPKVIGKRIPGIFTDEPNYGNVGSFVLNARPGERNGCILPWTPGLPLIFKKRYGYDLLPRLVELFYQVGNREISPMRLHYYDCITFMFVDAFAHQIGEWCAKNKCAFTGHVLCEETLLSQTSVVGSAMRFYEHMQAPGMDLLTEYDRGYDTAKQVSSVARQFGRRWRLTETYGCTGWDFNFAGHKALGDWQAALGINLRCQHLAWYTMEGEAKRDYPAGIFYQSPWWELYPKVEDYFARINALMSRGKEVRDLLVIHPIESMWAIMSHGNNQLRDKLHEDFWKLRDELLTGHIDFDYGDEDILARHGKVQKQNGQAILQVAKAGYKAAVVPTTFTLRSSTLELLKKFRQAGGMVVFAGEAPEHVDGKPSREAIDFAASCKCVPREEVAETVAAKARRLSVADEKGREIAPVLYCLREDKDDYYLFLCNTAHDNFGRKESDSKVCGRRLAFPKAIVNLFCSGIGKPIECDPATGKLFTAKGRHAGNGWAIETSFPPLGSRLFILPKKASSIACPVLPEFKTVRQTPLAQKNWSYQLSENNSLVLDRPEYRIGGKNWQPAEEILRVDDKIRRAIGVPARGGAMVQPWARKPNQKAKRMNVGLRYKFNVDHLPSGEFSLAIEEPQAFRITLNGSAVSTVKDSGWWCDSSLRRIPLEPELLKTGANELLLECDYNESHPGLEIVYLLGNFGTKLAGTSARITRLPDKLQLGDWCKQGLVFYSGSIVYQTRINPKLNAGEKLFVAVPDYHGTALRVTVEGKIAGVIAWEPNEIDITGLAAGKNEIMIGLEVIGHRRNSHGPFHLNKKWPRWTGSHQFKTSGENWFDGYQLVPCGLMQPPQLVIKKS